MIGSTRTPFRRLALALAATQLAAFTLAAVVEAASEHQPGPAHVEAAQEHCAPIHQPATCIACVLASVRARTPEHVQLALTYTVSFLREAPMSMGAPPRTPTQALKSRAPPSLAA